MKDGERKRLGVALRETEADKTKKNKDKVLNHYCRRRLGIRAQENLVKDYIKKISFQIKLIHPKSFKNIIKCIINFFNIIKLLYIIILFYLFENIILSHNIYKNIIIIFL